jgi:hypothetical protein
MTTLTNDEIVKIAKDVATANLVSGTWVDIKSASDHRFEGTGRAGNRHRAHGWIFKKDHRR